MLLAGAMIVGAFYGIVFIGNIIGEIDSMPFCTINYERWTCLNNIGPNSIGSITELGNINIIHKDISQIIEYQTSYRKKSFSAHVVAKMNIKYNKKHGLNVIEPV